MSNLMLDFYGFSAPPFSKAIGASQIFSTTAHREALGMLTLAAGAEDIVLLTGEIGIGKSVVLRSFLREIDENHFTPVYIRGSSLSPPQVYKCILSGLNIIPPYNTSAAKMLFFRKMPELGKKPIVLIDDSQDLPEATFAEIKSLINFEVDSSTCLTIVLTGQPETIRRLKMDHLEALRQRIRLAVTMAPMSCEETVKYIDHHTRIRGNNNGIFTEEAKAEIFKKTLGVARKINTICYNSLLNGAARELRIIDSKDIRVPELQDEKPGGRL